MKMLEKYLQNAQSLCVLTINSNYIRNGKKERNIRIHSHTNKQTNIFRKRLLHELSVEMLFERQIWKGGKMKWAGKQSQMMILECMLGKLMLLWYGSSKICSSNSAIHETIYDWSIHNILIHIKVVLFFGI